MSTLKALACSVFFLPLLVFSQVSLNKTQDQHALEFYGKLPIVFEPNQGQLGGETMFLTHESGFTVLFQQDSVEFFSGREQTPVTLRLGHTSLPSPIAGEDLQEGRTNYLIGNDPSKWHTGIPNYRKIHYSHIYPGIDLSFYGNGQHLEHDFTVAPGSDPRQIQLSLDGPGKLKKGHDGQVSFKTKEGFLVFASPVAYQEVGKDRKLVKASFVARGNKLSFKVGDYDKSLPLVIDPVLVYSTYMGGPESGDGFKIAVDAAGNAYLTGLTFDSTFPTTPSAFQTTCASCPNNGDVFVAKLNPTGTALVYSTYLGGSLTDQVESIAVDGNGNAIIGGQTASTDFPTLPVAGTTFNNSTGFITSLNAAGSALNWSHFSGGTNGFDDAVFAVAVDQNNNAYAAGLTASSDFPTTPGTIPHAPTGFPVNDVFVLKFDSTGAQQYSAVLGHNGSPSDGFANSFGVGGMTVDSTGEAVVVGSATAGMPTTPGSFDPVQHATPNTQSRNVFLVKIAADASALVFGTYLGGSGGDIGSAVTLDPAGNIYVTGSVGTADFPTTPGAFQTKFAPPFNCCGAFAAKFDSTGTSLLYSTFLGGTKVSAASTQANSIAVDPTTGNAYVAGDTSDTSFPLVHPIRGFSSANLGGPRESFVAELNADASAVLFSTVFSGSVGTGNTSVALDANNAVYLGGTSFDPDLPTTTGAFKTTVPPPPQFSQVNAPYIAKIDPSIPSPTACPSTLSLSFFSVRVGVTSGPQSVTVTNCGNADLTISNVDVSVNSALFQVQSNTCTTAVPAGGTCSIAVVFTPVQAGTFGGTLTIQDNASIGTQLVSLTGTGVLPQLDVPTSITFDQQLVGLTLSQTVFITNIGQVPANISAVALTGSDFAITSNNCIGTLLDTCFIGLSFTPSAAGTRTGAITISDDAVGNPHTISLSGTGVASYPVPTIATISHPTAQTNSGPFTMFVSGTNFFPVSVVQINGVNHATNYLSSIDLTVSVTPADLATLGEQTVTVTNPAPGGGISNSALITTFTTVPLVASNMVYEPFSRRIYAILSSASSSPDHVAIFDPFTGQIGAPIPLGGSGSGSVALTDDSQFLYVGFNSDHALGRFNLSTNQAGPKAPLGPDGPAGVNDFTVNDIVPVPGDPHTVVASLFRPISEAGVSLIRDGAVLSTLSDGFPTEVTPDSLGFTSDPTVFYGSGFNSGQFFQMGISGNTLNLTSRVFGVLGSSALLGSFVSDGSKFYTTTGQIVDPTTVNGTTVFPKFANFPGFTNFIAPATDIDRVFFADDFGSVSIFDSNTLQQVGNTLSFPNTSYNGMVRWGRDGFALISGDPNSPSATDHLLLFRTSLALPPAATTSAAISSLSPNTSAATGLNFILTVNGSGFAPGSVVMWNGAETTTIFVSSSQLTAKIPGTDIQGAGTAQVAVLNPGVGTSTATNFTITAGTAPFLQLSALSLNFTAVPVGGSSSQTVTVTNAGNAALSITSAAVTGDFKITNGCSNTLAGGASCQITVGFNPSDIGTRTGVLSIVDNATGSPHQVELQGAATDFQLATIRATSATVAAGQTATYNLSLSGTSGFSGPVAFTCTGAPAASTCSVNPSSITVTGTTANPFTVTVTTTARSTASVFQPPSIFWANTGWLAALGLLPLFLFRRKLMASPRIRKTAFATVAVGLILAGMVACGGGGQSAPAPPPVTPQGTLAGTYTLTVSASNNGAVRQSQLTLVVQ